MNRPKLVIKSIGTHIDWAPGTDPTIVKKKKKTKQGGKTKTVTINEKCGSFFDFFNSVQPTKGFWRAIHTHDEEELAKGPDENDLAME